MTTLAGDRYLVISSDGHAGAQVHEYREYRRELAAAEEEAGGPTPAPEVT